MCNWSFPVIPFEKGLETIKSNIRKLSGFLHSVWEEMQSFVLYTQGKPQHRFSNIKEGCVACSCLNFKGHLPLAWSTHDSRSDYVLFNMHPLW